jgi:hypothetical protein
VIFIFLAISSWLKTEKPGFVTVCVFSVLIVILVAYRYPDIKWYLPVIIYIPLFLLLIIGYNGEGMKFYITSILVCILISFGGSFFGVLIYNKRKKGFSRTLITVLTIIGVSIVILLTVYLTERNARLDKTLIAVLDTVFKADQSLIQENKGWDVNSIEWKSWNKKSSIIDSVNLIKVIDIINKYGWPGEDIIGWYGGSTLWVVIQHSTLVNQEKYVPLLRDAVKKGKARPAYLALLEDRILKNQGKEQIYGTHVTSDSLGIKKFWPIKDERDVNKRRFQAGLGPIQWYAKQMGFRYSLPNSKKKNK